MFPFGTVESSTKPPLPPWGRCSALKVEVWLRLPLSARMVVDWDRRYFSLGTELQESGGCGKQQEKDKTLHLLRRCSSGCSSTKHQVLQLASAAMSNLPLRLTAQPYGHHSYQEPRLWFNIYHIASLFFFQHIDAAQASCWISNFKCLSRRGVFT